MSNNDIPTKEIGEMLDTVSEKIPKLIEQVTKSFYSEEAGRQMGKAIGSMYKELIEAGIPSHEAIEMAKDYLNTAKSMMSNDINYNHHHKDK